MTKWRICLDDPLMIHNDRSGYDDEADFLYLHSSDQMDFENAAFIPFDEIKPVSGRMIECKGYVNAKRMGYVQKLEEEK